MHLCLPRAPGKPRRTGNAQHGERLADRAVTTTASAIAIRARAGAPRAAGILVLVLLSLAGLRAILLPPRPRVLVVRPQADLRTDPAARDAFAQAFARAYLTFDDGDVGAHDRAVDGFLAPGAGLDGSVQPAAGRAQRVVWTAVAAHAANPPDGGELVVVAVALAGQAPLRYLSVPVASGDDGALAVDAPPALVAPPPRSERPAPGPGEEVGDDSLRTVVVRGLAAYLRASAGDLGADLKPGARATVPAAPMALANAQEVTWTGPGAVAVLATVRDGAGATYELRYRLTVEHRERWFITAIGSTIDSRGAPS